MSLNLKPNGLHDISKIAEMKFESVSAENKDNRSFLQPLKQNRITVLCPRNSSVMPHYFADIV